MELMLGLVNVGLTRRCRGLAFDEIEVWWMKGENGAED
jgi:hypothetical protein